MAVLKLGGGSPKRDRTKGKKRNDAARKGDQPLAKTNPAKQGEKATQPGGPWGTAKSGGPIQAPGGSANPAVPFAGATRFNEGGGAVAQTHGKKPGESLGVPTLSSSSLVWQLANQAGPFILGDVGTQAAPELVIEDLGPSRKQTPVFGPMPQPPRQKTAAPATREGAVSPEPPVAPAAAAEPVAKPSEPAATEAPAAKTGREGRAKTQAAQSIAETQLRKQEAAAARGGPLTQAAFIIQKNIARDTRAGMKPSPADEALLAEARLLLRDTGVVQDLQRPVSVPDAGLPMAPWEPGGTVTIPLPNPDWRFNKGATLEFTEGGVEHKGKVSAKAPDGGLVLEPLPAEKHVLSLTGSLSDVQTDGTFIYKGVGRDTELPADTLVRIQGQTARVVAHDPAQGTLTVAPLTFKGEPLSPEESASHVRVAWPESTDPKAAVAAIHRSADFGVPGASDAFLFERAGYRLRTPARPGAIDLEKLAPPSKLTLAKRSTAEQWIVLSFPAINPPGQPRPSWSEGERQKFGRALDNGTSYEHPDVPALVRGYSARLAELMRGLPKADESTLIDGLRGLGYEQVPDKGGALTFVRAVGVGHPDSVLRLETPQVTMDLDGHFTERSGADRQALARAIREGRSYTDPSLREVSPAPK